MDVLNIIDRNRYKGTYIIKVKHKLISDVNNIISVNVKILFLYLLGRVVIIVPLCPKVF